MTRRADRQPNHLLRRARLARPSSQGPGFWTSRRELADAVNAWLSNRLDSPRYLDENHIGKLERGDVCWPREHSRQAFRAVLGAASDADLGFYNSLGGRLRTADLAALAAGGQQPPPPPVRVPELPVRALRVEVEGDTGPRRVFTVPVLQRNTKTTDSRLVTTVTISLDLDNNPAHSPDENTVSSASGALRC